MSGNWDDSDDDWDKSDDELDARLGLVKITPTPATSAFDEEEDLTAKENRIIETNNKKTLKTKGKALAAKKKAEEDRKEEEILARKAMELEAEREANMTAEERRELQKQRLAEADNALMDDFIGVAESDGGVGRVIDAGGKAMEAGGMVKMVDLKDHLKHARKVAQSLKGHGKVHLAETFFKECIQESKDALDENSMAEIIKICNVIKNEKVAATKRKVKGQAQKSKKKDKAEAKKAQKLSEELYGENDQHDDYDEFGAQYEDDFF